MAFSVVDNPVPDAVGLAISDDTLSVDLSDGRTIAVPLVWYPRLLHARPSERQNWRLIANGDGIRWPELDEDISVVALLTGKRSGETESSLRTWLAARGAS